MQIPSEILDVFALLDGGEAQSLAAAITAFTAGEHNLPEISGRGRSVWPLIAYVLRFNGTVNEPLNTVKVPLNEINGTINEPLITVNEPLNEPLNTVKGEKNDNEQNADSCGNANVKNTYNIPLYTNTITKDINNNINNKYIYPSKTVNEPLNEINGTVNETVKKRKRKTDMPYTEQFNEFWNAYPKRKEKFNAFKAWQKIAPDAETVSAIMAALEWQKNCHDWVKDGGQFIPYPAKWLNGRRWEDEQPEPIRPKPRFALAPADQQAQTTGTRAAQMADLEAAALEPL